MDHSLIADLFEALAKVFRDHNREKTIYLRTIKSLNLSVRSENALDREGFNTVGDLARTKTQLDDIRNFGMASLLEVGAALEKLGVKVGECIEPQSED